MPKARSKQKPGSSVSPTRAAQLPPLLSRASPATQLVLAAVFVASLFSLGLNIYLYTQLERLSETHAFQSDMKEAFPGDSAAVNNPPPPPPPPPGPPPKHGTEANLMCKGYGGPADDIAQEMVYWKNIPEDAKFVSPLRWRSKERYETQYLTFEPPVGGWNHIRMYMETVLVLAHAMGRTLVLPPEPKFTLLSKTGTTGGGEQTKKFSYADFFQVESIGSDHAGLDVMTMSQYLQQVAMKGKMEDRYNNYKPGYPPNNRTNWEGATDEELVKLYAYLRETSHKAVWTPEDCMAAFPKSIHKTDAVALDDMAKKLLEQEGMPKWENYVGKPNPDVRDTKERLKESWAQRKKLCIYNNIVQQQLSVHFPTDPKKNAHLQVHFYAYVFFQDWRHDLFFKRFVRDHMRYMDEIQCAAARVVEALRARAREKDPNNYKGEFDTMHVRRGDFSYRATQVPPVEMRRIAKHKLTDGGVLYIATDEPDKSFFTPLKGYYDVVFLDDFLNNMGTQINANYYGMIDQLVASRGRVFFGCWFSTFTGYINRLRGYHADNRDEPGNSENGTINSWYYALEGHFDQMQQYYPVKQPFDVREFPTAWRRIDDSIGDLGI